MNQFYESEMLGVSAPNRTFDNKWEEWNAGDLIVWEEDKQGPMFRIKRINFETGYVWWDDPNGDLENMTRCTNLLRVSLHDSVPAPAHAQQEHTRDPKKEQAK